MIFNKKFKPRQKFYSWGIHVIVGQEKSKVGKKMLPA